MLYACKVWIMDETREVSTGGRDFRRLTGAQDRQPWQAIAQNAPDARFRQGSPGVTTLCGRLNKIGGKL